MRKVILIVDDEPGIVSTLSDVLRDEGYETVSTGSGEEALRLYTEHLPDVVFLDVWLPDRDGLESLQAIREVDPTAAVVMMSGHGTAATAVKALKMGACDYIEKPLSYAGSLEALQGALAHRQSVSTDSVLLRSLERTAARLDTEPQLEAPRRLPLLVESELPQRTIRTGKVMYGLGLHSGRPTGMVLQPLPANSGIHFESLPSGSYIPAHVDAVEDTGYATTLARDGASVKTVEHLLSALHAAGVTNLLVKVHGEIPVLDGSSLEFCEALEDAGVVDQSERRLELVVDRPYRVEGDGGKSLVIEPAEEFSVSYLLRYPAPIGEQRFEFTLADLARYRSEIAPARTFGFVRDLAMMRELGLGSGGRLDNCILVGEDSVINTKLRFEDEFVRHKILDIIGDLYLLGYPLRGRVTASLTGHRFNILLLRKILSENA